MNLLNQYQDLRTQIFAYFGYVEDWRVLPLDDAREYFWTLDQDANGSGSVRFAKTEAELTDEDDLGECYENEIYTQRHLPKWVYRGAEYTLVVVDTHTDGNQLLQIFNNALERPVANKRL